MIPGTWVQRWQILAFGKKFLWMSCPLRWSKDDDGNNWYQDQHVAISKIITVTVINFISDFATNSYGESWDSSSEKFWVPLQKHWVPVQKTISPNLLGPLCDQVDKIDLCVLHGMHAIYVCAFWGIFMYQGCRTKR